MARSMFSISGYAALIAAASMAVTPAMAAPAPEARSPLMAKMSMGMPVNQSMDWGRRHHRDRGVDAGDIFAGVLILGGIAAIASAASKSDRSDERYEPYPYPEDGGGYQGSGYQGSGYSEEWGDGINNAVNTCIGQVERGSDRVASVDNAARTTDGWRISGQLGSGGNFGCWIDNDGRVRNVDLGANAYGYDGSYSGASAEGQWNEDDYARARERAGYPDPSNGQYGYDGYDTPGG